MSNNLPWTPLAADQNNPEEPLNLTSEIFDAALTTTHTVDVTAGNATLTATESVSRLIQVIGATTAGRTITLPQIIRILMIQSVSENTQDIRLQRGSTEFAVSSGSTVIARTDGTTDGLEVLSLGSGESGGSGVPDGGGTGQVLAKASTADGDVTWTDPVTVGASLNRPSIVQAKTAISTNGTITLDNLPAAGNLLVCLASKWSTNVTVQPTWRLLERRDGASLDGHMILVKIARTGEAAAQTPYTGSTGNNMVLFEISGANRNSVSDYTGRSEVSGSDATASSSITDDNSLVVGAFGRVGSNSPITLPAGVTAQGDASGTIGGAGGDRLVYAWSKEVDAGYEEYVPTFTGTGLFWTTVTLGPRVTYT